MVPISLMEKVCTMRWDKTVACLKKALMTILQPLSDLG